jgi:uncharacterized protein (DUF433 family)
MTEAPVIHDRGRGPEIKGTRITVFALFDQVESGWSPERLAEFYALTVPQVQVAIDYIRSHYDQVKADYEAILARPRRPYPPDAQAKLEATHQRFLARLTDEQRRRVEELHGERAAG